MDLTPIVYLKQKTLLIPKVPRQNRKGSFSLFGENVFVFIEVGGMVQHMVTLCDFEVVGRYLNFDRLLLQHGVGPP